MPRPGALRVTSKQSKIRGTGRAVGTAGQWRAERDGRGTGVTDGCVREGAVAAAVAVAGPYAFRQNGLAVCLGTPSS